MTIESKNRVRYCMALLYVSTAREKIRELPPERILFYHYRMLGMIGIASRNDGYLKFGRTKRSMEELIKIDEVIMCIYNKKYGYASVQEVIR